MLILITIVCIGGIAVFVRHQWKVHMLRKCVATEVQPGYIPPDLPQENTISENPEPDV